MGKKFYLIYLIFILVLTFYLSSRIIGNKVGKSIEIIKPRIIESATAECKPCDYPCEKIGEDYPRCTEHQFFRNLNDSVLPYGLCPNFEGIYDGMSICLPPVKVKINSYGFRDYEYILEKANDTFRIIVLGDSDVFGSGVELENTFPKVLEKMLNQGGNKHKYEVLNLGVGGYNMLEKVEIFKKIGISFNPDIILLVADSINEDAIDRTEMNNFIQKYIDEYTNIHNLKENELNKSFLNEIAINGTSKYYEMLAKRPFKEIIERIKKPLDDLANITKRKNVPVVFLYFFHIVPNEREVWKRMIEGYGWYMFDFEFYQKYKFEELILHKKDPHPNSFTHKLVAEEIYKKLFENNLLPT